VFVSSKVFWVKNGPTWSVGAVPAVEFATVPAPLRNANNAGGSDGGRKLARLVVSCVELDESTAVAPERSRRASKLSKAGRRTRCPLRPTSGLRRRLRRRDFAEARGGIHETRVETRALTAASSASPDTFRAEQLQPSNLYGNGGRLPTKFRVPLMLRKANLRENPHLHKVL
jgi:hypothetical protein